MPHYGWSKGVFVFCEKLFRTSYVCPTQTTRRRLSLQSVCFLKDISFKKVCLTSFWCKHGPPSSNLYITKQSSSRKP
ncbi:hypothetical protein Hanom_Chr13g01221231 [Helianthus anomalus]